MSVVYVDASAAVKLIKPEAESVALHAELADKSIWIASELLEVELCCVAHRVERGALAAAEAILARTDLLPLSTAIRKRAGAPAFSPPLRALDAIHLASALSIDEDLDAFVAYDTDLCEAALSQGLVVRSPA